jgi:hypothetical protein
VVQGLVSANLVRTGRQRFNVMPRVPKNTAIRTAKVLANISSPPETKGSQTCSALAVQNCTSDISEAGKLRFCGSPTFRTNPKNRGSERMESNEESVFKATRPSSCSCNAVLSY